ncbi:MAG: winged helix-turn-helix transcriptional regulator [Bacteroidales bacterium]|nr:winged helix-turn-helix transcriptional regulator [Bacteroidales bacterium]
MWWWLRYLPPRSPQYDTKVKPGLSEPIQVDEIQGKEAISIEDDSGLRKLGLDTEEIRKKYGRNTEEILRIMVKDPESTAQVMAEKINVSVSTIEKNIAKLKKEGIVERVGSTKSGYWKVRK